MWKGFFLGCEEGISESDDGAVEWFNEVGGSGVVDEFVISGSLRILERGDGPDIWSVLCSNW